MPDREMLELAAKAAGYWDNEFNCYQGPLNWNPRDDDGDAFRLAVALGISVTPYPIYDARKHSVIAKQRRTSDTLREPNQTETMEIYDGNPAAATRLAVLKCAAAIGKEMK